MGGLAALIPPFLSDMKPAGFPGRTNKSPVRSGIEVRIIERQSRTAGGRAARFGPRRGKSELRRARCWITSRRSNPRRGRKARRGPSRRKVQQKDTAGAVGGRQKAV